MPNPLPAHRPTDTSIGGAANRAGACALYVPFDFSRAFAQMDVIRASGHGVNLSEVLLGGRLIHHVVIPFAPAIHTPDDLAAVATALLQKHTGNAGPWYIVCETPQYGRATLACALEETTFVELQTHLRKLSWRMPRCTSLLIGVANRFHNQIRDDDLLVVIEDRFISAFSRGDGVHPFLAEQPMVDSGSAIASLAARWRLEHARERAAVVHVFSPENLRPPTMAGVTFHVLSPQPVASTSSDVSLLAFGPV